MRRVQPAEPVDSGQQISGNPLHHPVHLAMDIGMQPAKIRDARGRAHAAEEAITLDQPSVRRPARAAATAAAMRRGPRPARRRHIRHRAGIWRAGSSMVFGRQ